MVNAYGDKLDIKRKKKQFNFITIFQMFSVK